MREAFCRRFLRRIRSWCTKPCARSCPIFTRSRPTYSSARSYSRSSATGSLRTAPCSSATAGRSYACSNQVRRKPESAPQALSGLPVLPGRRREEPLDLEHLLILVRGHNELSVLRRRRRTPRLRALDGALVPLVHAQPPWRMGNTEGLQVSRRSLRTGRCPRSARMLSCPLLALLTRS